MASNSAGVICEMSAVAFFKTNSVVQSERNSTLPSVQVPVVEFQTVGAKEVEAMVFSTPG